MRELCNPRWFVVTQSLCRIREAKRVGFMLSYETFS